MLTTWRQALDDYERALQRYRALLDGDVESVLPPFVPPANLGAMTVEDVDRARRLLEQTAELERRLRLAHDRVARQLALVGRTRTDTSGPSFIDSRA